MATIGEIFRSNLLWLLDQRDMTETELTEKTGCSYGSVNRWCNGRCLPDMVLVDKLAEALGVEPVDFFRTDPSELRNIEVVRFDPTENYTKFYWFLFGAESEVPDEIVKVTNIVAAKVLPENYWDMLVSRYNLDGNGFESFGDIAERYHITRQRVSVLVKKAEKKMRESYDVFAEAADFVGNEKRVNLDDDSVDRVCDRILDELTNRGSDVHILSAFTDAMTVPLQSMREYGLGTGARNALLRNGYRTLGDVLRADDNDLKRCHGIGTAAVEEINLMKDRLFGGIKLERKKSS